MNGEDEYSKFTGSISKFINRQWSKLKSPGQIRSTKTLDQLLEEEYETLLREIDYLASEQSCFLSYKNDQFYNNKSSEDLAELLNKHSEEVLKTYVTQHDKHCKDTLNNRQDLVNYCTEIIIARPKCNKKLCSCKSAKDANQVKDNFVQSEKSRQVDNSIQSEKLKKTRSSSILYSDGKAGRSIEKHEEVAKQVKKEAVPNTKEIQTDDWNHDPNCSCGCCPKPPPSRAESRSVSTQGKTFEDATTSHLRNVASKNVLANCMEETVETQTSHYMLCVPENFETILKNNEPNNPYKFSKCTSKKDCGCDVYDVKEAIKRGLVLPSSDICIQNKPVAVKNKKNGKKMEKYAPATSADGNENSFETSSSDTEPSKKKRKQKDRNKKKNKKKKSSSEESESSGSSQQRQKEGTTKCFGTRKKRHCDEYCQGITGRQRSAQTLPIGTQDKNESADLYGEIDRKAVQTGTNSEMGIQLSSPPSGEFTRKKKAKDNNISEEEMVEPRGQPHKRKSKAERDQDNKEKLNDSITVCNKCGRQKRDCSSGCRNTIILPYPSGSNRAVPMGDAESLRMLIKMQSKDTNRQFDNILAELNQQKGEIRRLNNMYQKMVDTFYDSQKSVSFKYHSPEMSQVTRACGCDNSKSYEARKSCGCSLNNECKIANSNSNLRSGRSVVNSNNSTNNNPGGPPVRRFGPPNTAVSINMCDTCTVEIAPSNSKKNSETSRENDYHEIDKQRKEQLNETRKAIQNITVRFDGGKGDFEVCKQDSVSTLYKNDRRFNRNSNRSDNVSKKEAHQNSLSDGEVSSIHKVDKKYKKPREQSNKDAYNDSLLRDDSKDETLEGLPSLPRAQINTNNNIHETDYDPNKKPRRTYSSRVLVWLKKSWISIKHKRDECKESREKTEPLFNVCQRSAARAASNAWKYMKKKKFFTAR